MTEGIGPSQPADADAEQSSSTAPTRAVWTDVISPPAAACAHCGTPSPAAGDTGFTFCCSGCEAAYAMVSGLGLEAYYQRRSIDPEQRPLRPETEPAVLDLDSWVRADDDGTASISLLVEGLHCAACVWLIEAVLTRHPGVVAARINMTTRRLQLRWREVETTPEQLIDTVGRLGYRLVPYDPACLEAGGADEEKALLRAMAVAGFAAGNVMLLSVSVWAGHAEGMGAGTRTWFHWLSALIALPAIAYAGRPFFRAAWGALRTRHVTMDVPISIGVLLAAAMSVQQTVAGAQHAYFDAAIGLLFFLLIGRYLDRRARGRARSSAEQLLALAARAVTVVNADGTRHVLPPHRVLPGARVLATAGERIAVDGRVVEGNSTVDTSLIDGESTPKPAGRGTPVFAGTLNQSAVLLIEVTATGENTLLAEIAQQVELAEQQRGRYVVLADRVARLYAPVVHTAALSTFLLWWGLFGVPWQQAMMNAIAVLIITCPCALGLAVPAVQVVATGRLLRRGILVKSATALERLAEADTVVFDKTGTLTEGRPKLIPDAALDGATLSQAAALAAGSRHPLARALVEAGEAAGWLPQAALEVREIAGCGLERQTAAGIVRLGSAAFCGLAEDSSGAGPSDEARPELCFIRPEQPSVRFRFEDALRMDAADVVLRLRERGYPLLLLSGDRAPVVSRTAKEVGIERWEAVLRPTDKLARLTELAAAGRRVLMIGDGLNDAPALAAAHASMSPSSAIDVAQTAADAVFQGSRLAPVLEAVRVAQRARALVRQNLVLSLGYNLIAVPLAIAGQVTPLIAAVVMSTSSLLVIVNALRLNRARV
ncbi:MAG: heavy metal translocating P-type ATPase metal-binding domain-containing protein [Rhodospirillales bacterium]|nr:heavy metal translocating P-type ATPase metal-binding domain-containing protein [Rhodospirillales bacterium]